VTPPTPERSVLLVIDVQNDFCDPAGAFGRAGRDLALAAALEGCWAPAGRA
jgi:nicotinamidase-related amidase